MISRITQIIFLSTLLVACSASHSSLENVSERYKNTKDYKSLEVISQNLSKGMQRNEVERLLGVPDYSPIDGQYYYSSSQSEYSEDQGREVAVGLVIDYRDDNGDITQVLQNFWFGPIGE